MSVCMNAVILFLLKLVSVDFHLRNSEETFATNIGLKIKKLLELEAVSSFLYKKACICLLVMGVKTQEATYVP